MNIFTSAWYQEESARIRLHPEKNRGQNFLIDEHVIEMMMCASHISSHDTIIEIGCGFGILTHALAKTGADVIAYDIEPRYEETSVLRELIEKKLVNFVAKDFLMVNELAFQQPYVVISNLPYSISSEVLVKLLQSDSPPRSMTLMLQKEVVDRLIARPPYMTRLSVCAQLHAQVSKVQNVSKNAFWPQPKVDSAIVHFSEIQKGDEHILRAEQLAQHGFMNKRKKLANNLLSVSDNPRQLLKDSGLHENARAQELSVADWLRLAHISSNHPI